MLTQEQPIKAGTALNFIVVRSVDTGLLTVMTFLFQRKNNKNEPLFWLKIEQTDLPEKELLKKFWNNEEFPVKTTETIPNVTVASRTIILNYDNFKIVGLNGETQRYAQC